MNAAGGLATAAQVIVSLAVVIALALIASRLARRAGLRGQGQGIQVLQRVALNREASLAVVDVGGRGLLVGFTTHSVNVVTELTGAEISSLHEGGSTARPAGRAGRGTARGIGRRPGRGLLPTPRPQAGTEPRQGDPSPRPHGEVTVTELPEGAARTLARLAPTDLPAATAHTGTGTGSVLDPRTWRQSVEALRDLTARRG